MPVFHHILANNLIANITNFTVWFAVTFWAFLATRSVFATGMIAGLYLVLTASLAIWYSGYYLRLSAAYAKAPAQEPMAG